MNRFKIGDKVVCINNGFLEQTLTEGKIYSIKRIHPSDYVVLNEVELMSLNPDRFKPLPPLEYLMLIV